MTLNLCCLCEKDYEKRNLHRHLNSKQHQLCLSIETKCMKCEKLCNTEGKKHESQLAIDKKL